MSASSTSLTVALVGNPNTGKSTLFGALVGIHQRTGNYPGVTVEKKIGQLHVNGQTAELIDLPGTYSLAPRSPDEMVTVNVLLHRRVDLPRVDKILAILDAANLERNLYLLSQVRELGIPVVVALNMFDLAQKRGIRIDCELLSKRLGVPVIPVQANRGIGIAELQKALFATESHPSPSESIFPAPLEQEVAAVLLHLEKVHPPTAEFQHWPRYLAQRLLLDTSGYLLPELELSADVELQTLLEAARQRLADQNLPLPSAEAIARYGWVAQVLEGAVIRPDEIAQATSDRVDQFVTHRVWGSLLFVAVMAVLFSLIFKAATPLMDLIDAGRAALGEWLTQQIPTGALRSLLVSGVIGGVGGVLIFLPQILLLFLLIGILEDCGYMARAAYLMDKIMVRVGVSGKSFIPLLSSFACAIPGIMATRVIENRRDRLATMMIAPLMSCSARLPVYSVLIAAFIPQRSYLGGLLHLQGLTLLGMYLLGPSVAFVVAWLLKRTLLRGETPPFVLELPSYKWPSLVTVGHRMLQRGADFVYRAGTIILAVSIVIWALSYFPHNEQAVEGQFAAEQKLITAELNASVGQPSPELLDRQQDLQRRIEGAYQTQSYLGRMGQTIEPLVRPLGWDWRIGCAVIASFPAREVVMGALGVIYNLGSDVDSESEASPLVQAMRQARWDGTDRAVYNIPVALSIMVFFALCAQCASTLVILWRETEHWGWPLAAFVYMTALAYLGSLVTYQVGMRLLDVVGN